MLPLTFYVHAVVQHCRHGDWQPNRTEWTTAKLNYYFEFHPANFQHLISISVCFCLFLLTSFLLCARHIWSLISLFVAFSPFWPSLHSSVFCLQFPCHPFISFEILHSAHHHPFIPSSLHLAVATTAMDTTVQPRPEDGNRDGGGRWAWQERMEDKPETRHDSRMLDTKWRRCCWLRWSWCWFWYSCPL